jgi:hypothetical protein
LSASIAEATKASISGADDLLVRRVGVRRAGRPRLDRVGVERDERADEVATLAVDD